MEDRDQKVITFHSQYAAFLFRKRAGSGCELKPVPRAFSSSCGTAAFISGTVPEELLEVAEAMYQKEEFGWKIIWKEKD